MLKGSHDSFREEIHECNFTFFSGYGHRREHLDDSDNISYSPDYFGIQCPPYVDPPPPYTLPKPPYYQHGEQPPPYEEVVENSNESHQGNQITSNGNQIGTSRNLSSNHEIQTNASNRYFPSESRESNHSSVATGVNYQFHQNGNDSSLVRESRNGVGLSVRENSSLCNNSVDPTDGIITTDRHTGIVHFRNGMASNGGQLNITMGVQNRGRNNRNRFSDSQFSVAHSRNAHTRNLNVNQINGLNLEIRTGLQNLRHHGNSIPLQPMRSFKSTVNPGATMSSSSTDIGESSTSAESLESSPNFTPESPDMDREPANCNENGKQEANDADLTVKQFMDRQFGPFSRVRRYPTTMSQSWTSTQLGPVGMPNFSHSVSLGSFLPNQDMSSNNSNDRITSEERESQIHGNVLSDCKLQDSQLLRSKSEQLKTNGSLKTPPFKGIVRSHTATSNLPLPQTGCGARVSYVEPDELSRFMNDQRRAKSGDFSHFHHNTCPHDNIDSNVSECSSSSQNSRNMSIRNLDPDKIIVSKRQDLLRELRLSHLLQHPDQHASNLTSVKVNNCDTDTSKVINKNVSEVQKTGMAISNDAHYPDNSYRKITRNTHGKSDDKSEENDESGVNVPIYTVSDKNSLISNSDSSKNSTPVKTLKKKVKEADKNPTMSKSWHGSHVDSCEENLTAWMLGTDTLGRNVNTHFDKKVVDKDVSNLFYPQYKPVQDIDPINNTDMIPSSDMRACAAQMYNYETENRLLKKSKRKQLQKRHSAGCFPVKRDSSIQSNQQSPSKPKLSHKLKGFQIKDKHSGHRCSDSMSDSMKAHCCDKIKKHSCEDLEPDITEYDETPSPFYNRYIASPPYLVSPHFDHINSPGNCDRAGERYSLFPSKTQKRRSKSLGRIENVKSPEKRVENSSGRSHHTRAKKPQLLQSGKSALVLDDIVHNKNNISETTEPELGVTGPTGTRAKLI